MVVFSGNMADVKQTLSQQFRIEGKYFKKALETVNRLYDIRQKDFAPIPLINPEEIAFSQEYSKMFKIEDYTKNHIQTRFELPVSADTKQAVIKIDFIITLSDKICMIIQYNP